MILVLRALGVGDLATAVPALRALRAGYPDRPLVLAAPGWLAPLAELVGGIDRVLPTDGLTRPHRFHQSLRPAERAELAVNLHGRGPQSHRLLRESGARRLLAFRCPEAGHPSGPAWVDDEHEVTRWCRLVGWAGLPVDPADLALLRPAPGRMPVGATVLHPGTKVAAKRWAPERFAALARELTAAGHRVVVTGSTVERGLAARVAADAGLPAASVLAGRTGLIELATLVAYGRLVVSGDTGAAHLATGYGTPSVVLFGPVAPRLWGPPPDRPRHRVLWAGAATPPSASTGGATPPSPSTGGATPPSSSTGGAAPACAGDVGPNPSLAALTVDDVLAAVHEAERSAKVTGATAA